MGERMPVPGFWKRLLAFAIDGLLLGIVGALLGFALFDTLAGMGEWARLVGFAIVLPYFGVLGSRLGGGRTLGKRLFGLRVVGADGQPLPVPRAFLRAAVLCTPFLLNGVAVAPDAVGMVGSVLLGVAVLGGLFALAYLYLFNRRTRQSLHDLAVGSRVVVAGEPDVAAGQRMWRVHGVVVVVVALAVAALPFMAMRAQRTLFPAGFVDAYHAVSALPTVRTAMVSGGLSFSGGGERSRWISVHARRDVPEVEDPDFARRIAGLVVQHYPGARDVDALVVEQAYGFNIGIASGWRKYRHAFTPEELGALHPR